MGVLEHIKRFRPTVTISCFRAPDPASPATDVVLEKVSSPALVPTSTPSATMTSVAPVEGSVDVYDMPTGSYYVRPEALTDQLLQMFIKKLKAVSPVAGVIPFGGAQLETALEGATSLLELAQATAEIGEDIKQFALDQKRRLVIISIQLLAIKASVLREGIRHLVGERRIILQAQITCTHEVERITQAARTLTERRSARSKLGKAIQLEGIQEELDKLKSRALIVMQDYQLIGSGAAIAAEIQVDALLTAVNGNVSELGQLTGAGGGGDLFCYFGPSNVIGTPPRYISPGEQMQLLESDFRLMRSGAPFEALSDVGQAVLLPLIWKGYSTGRRRLERTSAIQRLSDSFGWARHRHMQMVPLGRIRATSDHREVMSSRATSSGQTSSSSESDAPLF